MLVLVDLQNDFLGRADLRPAAGVIIERAGFLLNAYRHHAMPVIHVRTTVTKDPDNRMAHWRRDDRWTCVEGSDGHSPPPSLREIEGEKLLHKQGFAAPRLVEEARAHASSKVLIAGVMTHACVRQAVLDFFQAGYEVFVAEDATGSDDPLHVASTRRFFEERGVHFAPSATLAARLLEGKPPGGRMTDKPTLRTLSSDASDFAREWRRTDLAHRTGLAMRLVQPLRERAEALARQMAVEIGKPVHFGQMEVLRSAEMIEAIARRFVHLETPAENAVIKVRRKPHGVVAIITPWNNPVYIPLGKIIPAILAGNTVLWKPAPEAASIAREIMALTRQCGWPPALLQVVEGDAHAGRALLSQPEIGAVTITASSGAGYEVAEVCARRHLPFQAELGGNNAAIVWRDADLNLAAEKIAAGAFEMTGQRCTANRRVIVHESIMEELMRLLIEKAAAMSWGDPLDPNTRIGPMVSATQRDRVDLLVQRAIREGCSTFYPLGQQPFITSDFTGSHSWLAPVVIICPDPGLEIVQEETFGPVLVVQTARDWEHALALCNGVSQGLAAALFSTSADLIRSFLDEAQAGILKINASTSDAMVDVPFGGWKASGSGPPEHGSHDLDFFTRIQTVYL
ncbi:aldehyde dehydrogenase family protein [Phragmitibacter flavus]|nr:aldehyde dehydrogenase family protein [Phragmitibacter flavus]